MSGPSSPRPAVESLHFVVAYLLIGAGIIQVIGPISEALDLPEWTSRLVVILLILGLPMVLVLAWIFDIWTNWKAWSAASSPVPRSTIAGPVLETRVAANVDLRKMRALARTYQDRLRSDRHFIDDLLARGFPAHFADRVRQGDRQIEGSYPQVTALCCVLWKGPFDVGEIRPLHERVEIHSVPGAGGILGEGRFRFKLWGEAVELAEGGPSRRPPPGSRSPLPATGSSGRHSPSSRRGSCRFAAEAGCRCTCWESRPRADADRPALVPAHLGAPPRTHWPCRPSLLCFALADPVNPSIRERPLDILIVESAAKARTLKRYLGSGWKVMATGGHVQTLPSDRKKHGKDGSKAYWSNRPGALPTPPWVWTEEKGRKGGEEAVQAIVEAADEDTTFWIATDPDREGEFIAWRLKELLAPHGPTRRVTFQEVTEEAVKAAIGSPREVEDRTVESAQVRMFLDRLVGYRGSKMARAILPGGSGGSTASMGRVQTPTLGFVVERELEREAHVPIPYFEVRARASEQEFRVRFHEPADPDMWKDDGGKAVPTRTFDGARAEAAEKAIREAGQLRLTAVSRGERSPKPRPPFSTDALLQAAGSRFSWSPGKTSALASMLYEEGHITYIRTDSTRLAASAVESARKVVESAFGNDHLGPKASGAQAAPKGAPIQDAHEAIRPTRIEVEEPEIDDADARKLYRLIRAHTLASQMAPSRFATVSLEAEAKGLELPLTGSISWRIFAGWEAAYREFRAEPATEPPAAPLEEGAEWPLDPEVDETPNPELVEDETRPPARFRRHTLIREMKEAGIGRPSTYASTVEKLEKRSYVEVEDGALIPTERGRGAWLDVAPLYVRDDSDTELFSPQFTALLEGILDGVARGEQSAPEVWEKWRDEVRDLHEIARARKSEGNATPRSLQQLSRLLENAPDDAERPADPEALSEKEVREWIGRLREAGVHSAPSDAQRDYIASLIEDLEMTAEDAGALVGVPDPAEIRSSARASALIEELKSLADERRPPSKAQRDLVAALLEKAGLSETKGAALIGESDLEGLTGGRDGTASALIDALQEHIGKGERGSGD
jgi:DNA topoisomerase IA